MEEKTQKFEMFESKNKPFAIIKKDEKYIITIGRNVATDKKFKSLEEAENYIETKPYELIFTLVYTAMNMYKETIETEERVKNTIKNHRFRIYS